MADVKKLDPQVIKERVGKHLRTADEFTRSQRYEEAVMEIELALEIDSKNNYARSFLERVKLMQKRTQQSDPGQAVSEEATLEERMEVIARHFAAAEEHINRKEYKLALEEVARVYKIDSKNYYAQTYSERIETLMLEESAEGAKLFKPAVQPDPSSPQGSPEPERGSTFMYRELLKDVWMDGKVTEEEAQELSALREIFHITQEDHELLERDIKVEAYLEALRIAWRDHSLSALEQKALQSLVEKYQISPEEQAIAESRYGDIKQPQKSRGTVLLVDHERESLVSLSKVLKQHGYTALLAQKPEDALQILITHVPAIILSEVLFSAGQMDGLSFFKKLREHSALKHTPFLFISTIKEKKVIHASYRLGIDHYLIKPVDTNRMLALIEGKLRIST